MTEQKASKKNSKNQDSKKNSPVSNNQGCSRKQNRKGDNPTRFTLGTEQLSESKCSTSWICKNSACRAVLSIDNAFCRRCSCCICHLFDDNKDPSLWLVCESEAKNESCGLSCHIECALRRKKVGVVNLGQFMQLDGSYCCASCGKVSGILGCWKKQLATAKDARRVDALCYRISVAYRLLDGTSRFKDLHEIVKDAKIKLEDEVGPICGEPDKMARGIVSRLPIASDVQQLCCDAIEKADALLANVTVKDPKSRVDSLPAACKFLFEDIKTSSVTIVLIEIPVPEITSVKGYKLWYSSSKDEAFLGVPLCTFPREQRRVLISNLQPCTEYTVRIVSYMESGDLGYSEAKFFTRSVEIIQHKPNTSPGSSSLKKESLSSDLTCVDTMENTQSKQGNLSTISDFKVRELGKVFELAENQQNCCVDGISSGDAENCSNSNAKFQGGDVNHSPPPAMRGLDLNVVSVPDLNEDVHPPFDCSRDEDNGFSLGRPLGPDDDAASHGIQKDNGRTKMIGLKRSASPNEDALDSDSTLINGSPFRGPAGLDENFEYCVKIIRWLECGGHIKQDFRLKFLTWFSLRSTEQERRVVNTFIQTLIDDPKSLAGQLVDSFSEIIACKRLKNGFSGKPGIQS